MSSGHGLVWGTAISGFDGHVFALHYPAKVGGVQPMMKHNFFAAALLFIAARGAVAEEAAPAAGPEGRFSAQDLFDLSMAGDPQISSDGTRVAYVRVSNDIMTDRARRAIWLVDPAPASRCQWQAGRVKTTPLLPAGRPMERASLMSLRRAEARSYGSDGSRAGRRCA